MKQIRNKNECNWAWKQMTMAAESKNHKRKMSGKMKRSESIKERFETRFGSGNNVEAKETSEEGNQIIFLFPCTVISSLSMFICSNPFYFLFSFFFLQFHFFDLNMNWCIHSFIQYAQPLPFFTIHFVSPVDMSEKISNNEDEMKIKENIEGFPS